MEFTITAYGEAIERSKKAVEREMYYLLEENRDLEHKVELAKQANAKLQKNRTRLNELIVTYLAMNKEEK